MRFCMECGEKLKEGSEFCTSCGAKQEIVQVKPKKEGKAKGNNKVFLSFHKEHYFFIALLFISVIPGLIESLIMLRKQTSLTSFSVLMIELVGMFIGLVFLSLWLVTLRNGAKSMKRMVLAGTAILWIYIIGSLSLRLMDGLSSFALFNQINFYWIYYIVYTLIVLIALTLMSIILYKTITTLVFGVRGRVLNHKKLLLSTILLLGVSLFLVPDLMVIFFSGEFFPLPISFVGTLTQWISIIALQGLFLKRLVKNILKAIENNDLSQENEKTLNTKFKKTLPALAGMIVVLLLGFDMVSGALYSSVDAIEASIQDDMNQGAFYMAAGDIEMAMYMYDAAYDKTKAWLAVTGNMPEDANLLEQLYRKNPEDEQIEYLMAMKNFSVSQLELAILEDKNNSTWYHLLLDAYKAQENNKENPVPLTEKQELIRNELLNSCIAMQTLVNNSIGLNDIEGKEKDIKEALEPYLEFIDSYGSYKIINQISLNGGMNTTIMGQLLNYAEENPENLLAQYTAFEAGRSFLFDGAGHYERSSEAAIRFGDLYMEQLEKNKTSKKSAIAVNIEIAYGLMDLLDYNDAIIYIEEARALGAEASVSLLAGRCYNALENYEKALEMSSLALEDDPSNIEALNLAMTSALKAGEITKSMTYAGKLLDLLFSLEGDAYLITDADLYIYVQYLTVWNPTQWTPEMKYKVYPDLNQEQMAILEENPMLDHYIQALYYTFSDKQYDLAWDHTKELLKTMENSAQIQYLAGTIHFNKKAFEKAVEYYKASLAIDDTAPTLWYALANAYDALEDYQQAYNASIKVNELIQYSNHAVDIYGVHYHNNALLYKLTNELEREGN